VREECTAQVAALLEVLERRRSNGDDSYAMFVI